MKKVFPCGMKRLIAFWLAMAICFGMTACAASQPGNKNNDVPGSVMAGGESFTIEEFYDIARNNKYKFSQYVGEGVVVSGKLTEIQTDWISSNLNHSFDVSITIENKWVFEVSSKNPMLDQINLGDFIVVTGVISTSLYGTVYCYGNSTIRRN